MDGGRLWVAIILVALAAQACTGGSTSTPPTSTPSTTASPSPGADEPQFLEVTTSSCLNIREAPSLDAAVLGCAPDGTVLRQTGGPRTADDRRWFRVGGAWEGWAAAEFLRRTDGPPTRPSPDD